MNLKLLYRHVNIHDPANTFVWSDLHLGHDRDFIWRPRGFNSVQEHDAILEQRWKDNLNEDSVIFNLGDIVFGLDAEDKLLRFLHRVPFKTLYLMSGNHTAGFSQIIERSDNGVFRLNANKTIVFIPNYLEVKSKGKTYVLSHYPILSAVNQGKTRFGGMVHGHCHGNLHKDEYASQIYEGKVIDVGVEVCRAPMSFDALRRYMAVKKVKTYDHHTNSR